MRPLICLASTSPRRAELLTQIGVGYEIRVADVDETPKPSESPEVYVLRMALAKAAAVQVQRQDDLPVLAADTVVVVDDDILGKPLDQTDGLAMLQRLSGRLHQVLTAVALLETVGEERSASRLSVSKVSFRVTTEAERLAYWQTGEPADKAGAYAIQGYAAAFIERLEGSYSGVMGLPLFETAALLHEFGIEISDYWVQNRPHG